MKYWKEPYSIAKAIDCGIHGNEGISIIGYEDKQWLSRNCKSRWIYHVEVCGFQFSFFSIEMLDTYIDYFNRKILPTSRFYGVSPFSNGPAASIGDGQSPFERLPAYLRKKNRRPKVLKALLYAKKQFSQSDLV